jgi:outer membrane lipoprotein SlyB
LSKIKDQSNKQLYENTVGAEKNLEVESLQFIKANYQQLQTIASAKEAAGTVGGVVGGVVGSAVGGVVGSTIGGVIGNSAANTGASKALGNGDEIIRKFEVITKEKILKDPKNEKMYLDNQTLINTQINALAGKK